MSKKKCWIIFSALLFCCLQLFIHPWSTLGESTGEKLEITAKTSDGKEYRGGWTNKDVEIVVTNCNIDIKVCYLVWEKDQEEQDGIITLEPPVFQEEGEYKIRIWTEDGDGNRNDSEQDILRDISIDRTKPKISISYSDEDLGVDGIYFASGRKAVITVEELNFSSEEIAIIDNGMAAFKEELSDGDWVHLEDGISHMAEVILDSGQYAFQISCKDKAGNKDLLPMQEFIIDNEIPQLDFSKSQEDLVAWNRDIKYLANSGASGIRRINLYKDNTFLATIYQDDKNGLETGVNTVKKSGITTIEENGTYSYQIISKSGMTSEIMHGASYSNIDRQKPKITINKNDYKEGIWTSDSVTLEIINETDNLGSNVYYYRTQTSQPWIEFDGIMEITENTEETFYFYVESEAQFRTIQDKDEIVKEDKNFKQAICSVKSVDVKVDKTYPEDLIVKYDSIEAKNFMQSSLFRFFFKNTVTVTLEAGDDFSGIKSFEVILSRIDGTEITKELMVESPHSGITIMEFPIAPQFVGKISVSASDMAGLSIPKAGKSKYAALAVDAEAPTAPEINGNGYSSGQWVNQDVILEITGAESDSGIDYYEYTTVVGEEPSETAEWLQLPAFHKETATPSEPKNVRSAALTLGGDTHFTYYFRGVSNTGVKGEISSYKVNIQKTIPANGQLIINSPNESGWYQQAPMIKFLVPTSYPSGVSLYYKVWCLSEGESEDKVSEVLFNGRNYPDFTKDGKYFLRIWTLDEAGNRSSPDQDIFRRIYIDGVKPVASLQINESMGAPLPYYNKPQIAKLIVEETNFNPERCNILITAILNGIPISAISLKEWITLGTQHIGFLPFQEDGDYTIHISCEDEAGNMLEEEIYRNFTIDTTLPQLEIQGVSRWSANIEPVCPKIICSDANLDMSKMEISLEGYMSGSKVITGSLTEGSEVEIFQVNPIDEDDNYTLSITIYDKAGNAKRESVVFSVNQNGAVFVFKQKDIQGSYTNIPFFPSIQILDVDGVTIVSFTINGKEIPYEFKNGILTVKEEIRIEGKYVMALDVIDGAGNRSLMKPIEFYYDGTKPAAHIIGIQNGNYYFEAATIQIFPSDPEDIIKEIWINGELLAGEDYILKEDHSVEIRVSDYQKYTLEVIAEDEAGNISDIQSVSFELTNNWFLKFIQRIKNFFKGSKSKR